MVKPAFTTNNIPIVFSSDNDYSRYLGVTVQSIIKSSNDGKNYDILIIESDISEINKSKLRSIIKENDNFSIRFFNVKEHLVNFDESAFYLEKDSRVSASTYYRFLIPVIFSEYEKIIYLDCDLIVLDDISHLYDIDIGDNVFGAAKDYSINLLRYAYNKGYIDYKGIPTPDYETYLKDKLLLSDPEKYFNCGVLICNVSTMIEKKFFESCIEKLLEIKQPIYWDQCILNSLYHENVKIIDLEWNLTVCTITFEKEFIKLLPKNLAEELYVAYKSHKIIHYAADGKPWKCGPHNGELSHSWWHYAMMSPFYDELIQPIKSSRSKNKKNQNESERINKKTKIKILGVNMIKIYESELIKKVTLFGFLPVFNSRILK